MSLNMQAGNMKRFGKNQDAKLVTITILRGSAIQRLLGKCKHSTANSAYFLLLFNAVLFCSYSLI
jgi:hypothetical protein